MWKAAEPEKYSREHVTFYVSGPGNGLPGGWLQGVGKQGSPGLTKERVGPLMK